MLVRGSVPFDLLKPRGKLHAVLEHLGIRTGRGCEVGVHLGVHAEEILRLWPGELWLVDGWQDVPGDLASRVHWGGDENQLRILGRCMHRLAPYCARTRWLRAFSPQAAESFPDGFFDWVYLDGTHGYEQVKADLKAWYPKVRDGGLFCGHDYYDGYSAGPPEFVSGVKTAVDEFAAANGYLVFGRDENWHMVSPEQVMFV